MITLPPTIARLLGDRPHETDTTGMSGSAIWLYEDMVLKAEKISPEAENEYSMLTWMADRLPVPRVLAYEQFCGTQYMVLSRLSGEMTCAPSMMERPETVLSVLAEGLQQLWKTDITDCPVRSDIRRKLMLAEERVTGGLVDPAACDPATFGNGGFRDPVQLLGWLQDNRPPEEEVLTHGDFCLPNIFCRNGRFSGYLDVGRAGIGDRWQDIALCWRSLTANARGDYGKAYPGYSRTALFTALGISPDWDRIRYYILLDELF